ncbi:biotin-dependent carboxyltransferase family protein [Rhodococcoides kroppenstedtii]|uniref:5-oxoprolinase subunit C family protein n=1 Tax=Rhodococcoides kroppenstedtii TaxID=293050 RepID=UPI001BDF1F10|nr:biotin-dependent carboxyltransferase family protein [Rhodococcus kroppenstedtii]MBT1191763.1 biotin-dependent carboxyltransferase family protein [Rhodococcus kroppenstedtii]
MASLTVVAAGPSTTVQDRGRPEWASLGVGRSGAADRWSHDAANRLVGNDVDAATLEVTLGGLVVRTDAALLVALAGAPVPWFVDGVRQGPGTAVVVPAGAEIRLDVAPTGLRAYVAVRGGIDVPRVLGSRATDALSGIGPPPVAAGDVLDVGTDHADEPATDLNPYALPDRPLRLVPGPRADWFAPDALDHLLGTAWTVTADSNRVGARLTADEPLRRSRDDELASEGMMPGALQVPPSGMPVLFLADHPVTGGYPVIAVVVAADVDLAAQARPGSVLRFTR